MGARPIIFNVTVAVCVALLLAAGGVMSSAAAQAPDLDVLPGPESYPQFDGSPEFGAPIDPALPPTSENDTPGQEEAAAPGAREEDADERLERLLDQLAEARTEADSKRLERTILDAWHRSGSDTVDLLLRRASVAIQDKDYALALEYLDTIVQLEPEFPEGWNKRATVYYMINEYTRAMADIGRVLALQPRHFGALSGLGMIFQELDNKTQALTAFRRAREIHPNLSEIERSIERLTVEVEGRGI